MYFGNAQRYKKNATDKELKDLIYETYNRRSGFSKENSYYSMKY